MVTIAFSEVHFQNFFQISKNGHFKNVQNPFPFSTFGKKSKKNKGKTGNIFVFIATILLRNMVTKYLNIINYSHDNACVKLATNLAPRVPHGKK